MPICTFVPPGMRQTKSTMSQLLCSSARLWGVVDQEVRLWPLTRNTSWAMPSCVGLWPAVPANLPS